MQAKTKKILAWILIPLAVIAIIILISNPILKSILERELHKSIDGEIQYSYSDLKVDLFSRSIHFDDIKWEINKQGKPIQKGSAAEFDLKGISILPMLSKNKKLSINKINIQHVEIQLYPSAKDSSEKTAKSPYDIIKKELQSLNINHFNIEDANIQWYNKENKVRSSFKGVYVDVDEIKLDSSIARRNNGWFSVKSYSMEMAYVMSIMNKELHRIEAGPIHLIEDKNSLQIDSLRIVPLYSKNELAKVYGYQTNWMNVSTEKIMLEGIRFDQLIYHGKLLANNCQIEGLKYSAFREKSYDYHPDRYTNLPQMSFKELGITLSIDTVSIPNAYLEYEEHQPPANENGKVFFSNTNIQIVHLSNKENDQPILMYAEAALMGKSKLIIDFSFPMNNDNGSHSVKGKLGSMQLSELNPVFEPLAFFSIRSGSLNSLHFDFQADNFNSKGKVNFDYEDLKIKLLNKDNLEKSGLLKDVASFLANKLIINSDNDENAETRAKVEASPIAYKRNTKKSILNYWWKSLFSGMQTTALKMESIVPSDEGKKEKKEN